MKISERSRRCLRLIAYVVVVQLVAVAWITRQVRARTDAALVSVGAALMTYARANHQQAPRRLMVNGAELQVSVGNTVDSASTVLDHFHRRCVEASGGVGQQLRDAASQQSHVEATPADALLDGVLRAGDDQRGTVACVDTGTARLTLDALAARARAFLQTGDLSVLGNLRFVSAERGDARTVFVAFWSEGALRLAEMFPAQGDAPGVDVPGVPRPTGSRRILSAWEVGQDKSIGVYEVPAQRMGELVVSFRQQLRDAGYALRGAGASSARGFVAERGEQSVMIAFAQSDDNVALLTISSLSDATGAVTSR